ncbi:MAG: TRAP transporter small permease subunit [Alphaproteobacteria bacterium]|nr:TRAP transporter small permease subunit [Alphaproteobacteria bacterium]
MALASRLRNAFERVLETITVTLLISLAVVVVLAVIFRKLGSSFVWYDEVASVQLVWLTYYGAVLAALKRAHIGFPGLVNAMPPAFRVASVLLAEAIVIAFFAVVAWTGVQVHYALAGDYLVSLPEVPVQLTKSVMPIGAVLFIVAELIVLPQLIRDAHAGRKIGGEDTPEPAEP